MNQSVYYPSQAAVFRSGSISSQHQQVSISYPANVADAQATYTPCDILPHKPAAVRCDWCGGNFCEEAAEVLRSAPGSRYFSAGRSAPRPNAIPNLPQEEKGDKGIGIVLEIDPNNQIMVKRIAPDGSAARSGLLQVGDIVRMVDGMPTARMGREVARWVLGPDGSTVEMVVERHGTLLPPKRILRGDGGRPPKMIKGYDEVPFYLSHEDREEAKEETSARIRRMRQMMGLPDHGLMVPNPPSPDEQWGPSVLL